jgi:hypothetical protein
MIITTPLDVKKLEALQASGWDIMMRCAHVRGFDPEIDDEPTASLESVRAPRHGLVAVKVGQGCLGHDSSTIVDIKQTADNYRQRLHEPLMAGGGECHARPALLGALRSHVEASCPEYSRGQAEEQIRLLAHAVFVNLKTSYPFHGYETGEAYRSPTPGPAGPREGDERGRK